MCYVVGVMPVNDLSSTVRDTLARLATTGDRTSPAVFAGRDGEFRLLNDAARLRPWFDHTVALAHAFGRETSAWTPYSDVKRALMASDNTGDPVAAEVASRIVKELRASGYIAGNAGSCRPALPSLATHFKELLCDLAADDEVAQAIRSAVPN